jgi:5-hydroxyisourate hydrolase
MSAITTHVLDVSRGRPAAGLTVLLEERAESLWARRGDGVTDADGRCRALLAPGVALEPGVYRLTFQTGAYFHAAGVHCFHPEVQVTFEVTDPQQHYHVPLLLSPYGYTTYRGS